jgi:hypothetical protein
MSLGDGYSPSPRVANKQEQTVIQQAQVLSMYRDNPNFSDIGRAMGFSPAYIRKLYKGALRTSVVDEVEDLRKVEIARLDKMYADAIKMYNAPHPLVNSGIVVRDVVDDPITGQPLIDPETGHLIRVRLQDTGPALAALAMALKISERRSRLMGMDAPTKTAFTNPTGDKEASAVLFYIPNNNRDVPDEQEEAPGT